MKEELKRIKWNRSESHDVVSYENQDWWSVALQAVTEVIGWLEERIVG
jgi:hypothetical protein